MKRLFYYFLWIFAAWFLIRLFVSLPEVIMELWFKPVIWLVPLFWWQMSDRKAKIKLYKGDMKRALIWGGVVGAVYFVIVKIALNSVALHFDLNLAGIGLVTAVVEEMAFAGILLPRVYRETKNLALSLFITAGMYALIRLPVNIFIYHLDPRVLAGTLTLAFFVGLVNGFIRIKTDNVAAPITAHFLYLIAVL